jgi:hypothetical protein
MDTLTVLVLFLAAGYVLACVIFPYAACRWCGGSGKHPSPSGKAWRVCRRCKGRALRVRLGRRVFDALRSTNL